MNISYKQTPQAVFEYLDSASREPRNTSWRSRNPLLNIPIARRLVLGFFIPALIAAFIAGAIGLQSTQLLNQESTFYQNLFQGYSSLTTGNDFLQLMNFKVGSAIADASVPNQAQDQLNADRTAVQGLETSYDTLLKDYLQQDLLTQHPDQSALFDEAGHPGQAARQRILASSAERTWQVYRSAQDLVMQDIQNGLYQDAGMLERAQGEPTYSDALSALRQLIQFDRRLAGYVQDATAIQQRNELITTLVAVALVLFAIGLIGWLIYGTLVRRLHQLRGIAQAVEQGQIHARAILDGRDEITDVSTSVNTMLDTIVGLLEETRVQRDALVGAAERLFSDMRLVNNGELDIRTAVDNDPIGMLGNAFHFTVGRLRRFVLRNQAVIEQLDIVSQQGMERADSFLANARNLFHAFPLSTPSPAGNSLSQLGKPSNDSLQENPEATFVTQVKGIREQVQHISYQNIEQNGRALLLAEQGFGHYQQVTAGLRASNAVVNSTTIRGLRSLEAVIRQFGRESQTFHQEAARSLTEIDTNLHQLSAALRFTGTSCPPTSLTIAQAQELTRLIESFGQEVTGFAKSLRRIIQEMRKSLAPFRMEVIERSEITPG